ncbi:MAG: hypothetical protein HZB30_09590 [Nitrospirae bacterium]|nr:hypothetical protein [Nitrospirota bacterium]
MGKNQKYVMRIIARLIFIIALSFLMAPAVALGDMRRFIPRIYSTEGELEVNMSHEERENLIAETGLKTSDTFFSEKIVLTANGFVYHPRFILFLGKLGGGSSQEKFKSNSSAEADEGSWNNMFIKEYEFRTLILPEHPYNLELFARRYNPFIIGRAAPGLKAVSLSEGALFTYKKRPVTFKLNYTFTNTESNKSTTDTKHLNTYANYFKENFSLAGGFSRSDSRNSTGWTGSKFKFDSYSIENQIRLFQRKVYLTSIASQVVSRQKTIAISITGNRFSWTEQLNMYLPWNFNTLLTYNYFKTTEKTRDLGTYAERILTSKSNGAGLSITHTLYNSLNTAYNFNYNSSSTSTGDSMSTMHFLNSAYTKKIPWGTLMASIQLSNSILDRRGAPTVTDENANAPIFGEFTLRQSDVDAASIRVSVIDPVLGPIELTKDIHYSLIPFGNTFTIFVKDIPAAAKNPDPLFVYEFRVAYSFTVGSFELEKSGFGYTIKLALFDSLVNPYYGYSHETQKLLSGTLPGGPDEVTSQTVGLLIQKRPYSLLMEYQDYESRFNPSKRYRAETSYRQNFALTTNLDARVYYKHVENLESPFNPNSTTVTSTGIDLKIGKRFPRKNLTVSAVGSYSNIKHNFETNTYSFGTTVSWSIAKLDLSLGANVSHTETALDTGKQEIMNQFYYLTMKRKLF